MLELNGGLLMKRVVRSRAIDLLFVGCGPLHASWKDEVLYYQFRMSAFTVKPSGF